MRVRLRQGGPGEGEPAASGSAPSSPWRPAEAEAFGQGLERHSWLPYCHCRGILHAMKATIDAAGRIVVPKPLRQALGLKPGQLLEMRAGDGRLEIEIVPTAVTLKKRGKGVVAVPDTELTTLTAEPVRQLSL